MVKLKIDTTSMEGNRLQQYLSKVKISFDPVIPNLEIYPTKNVHMQNDVYKNYSTFVCYEKIIQPKYLPIGDQLN